MVFIVFQQFTYDYDPETSVVGVYSTSVLAQAKCTELRVRGLKRWWECYEVDSE